MTRLVLACILGGLSLLACGPDEPDEPATHGGSGGDTAAGSSGSAGNSGRGGSGTGGSSGRPGAGRGGGGGKGGAAGETSGEGGEAGAPDTTVGGELFTDATSLALSPDQAFACVVDEEGRVHCWGESTTFELKAGPLELADASAVSVALGIDFLCQVTAKGKVSCMGKNYQGVLGVVPEGVETSDTLLPIDGISNAVSLTAGVFHACALLEDETVKCWGSNVDGALGGAGMGLVNPVPVAVPLEGVTVLHAARTKTCALIRGGELDCWGEGFEKVQKLGDFPGAIELALNQDKVSLLLDDGTVLSPGGTTDTPRTEAIVPGAVAIALGVEFGCALIDDGTVSCWGYIATAEGDDASTRKTEPVRVDDVSGAVAVSADPWGACALLDDGSVMCWGGIEGTVAACRTIVSGPGTSLPPSPLTASNAACTGL